MLGIVYLKTIIALFDLNYNGS